MLHCEVIGLQGRLMFGSRLENLYIAIQDQLGTPQFGVFDRWDGAIICLSALYVEVVIDSLISLLECEYPDNKIVTNI